VRRPITPARHSAPLCNDAAVESEFAAAVDAQRAGDDDSAWATLCTIASAPSAIEFAIARLHDADPVVRETACNLVAVVVDVNYDARPAAVDALLAISAPDSAESLVRALGRTHDARVVARMLEYAADPDDAVRLAVACELPNLLEWGEPEPPEITDALIVLSRDVDGDVRDWATFGLGQISESDGPAIRAALLDRTTDSFQDAREEGVCGLARRRDPRGIALLRDLLCEESLQVGVFSTAAMVGDSSYLPLLEAFDPEDIGIALAMRECDPAQRAVRDDFAWRLMTALAAMRPDLEPRLYCERFDWGIWMDITVAGERCSHRIDALIENAAGDVDRAILGIVG
jgi:hypothetical protein